MKDNPSPIKVKMKSVCRSTSFVGICLIHRRRWEEEHVSLQNTLHRILQLCYSGPQNRNSQKLGYLDLHHKITSRILDDTAEICVPFWAIYSVWSSRKVVGWCISVGGRRRQRRERWSSQNLDGTRESSVGARTTKTQLALLWTLVFAREKHNQICVFEISFWQLAVR